MRVLLSILLVGFCLNGAGQLVGHLELGIGAQGNELMFEGGGGAGTVFYDKLHVYGGLKLQRLIFIPTPDEAKYKERGIDTDIYNVYLYAGTKYFQEVFKLSDNRSVGVFPEFKLCFIPYVPRSFSYEDANDDVVKLKGDYAAQLAYSYAFGIYFGEIWGQNISLKMEFNTLDPLKSLRKEAGNFKFPEPKQAILVLSLTF